MMPFNVCFTCAHYDDMRCVKKRYGVSSRTIACSDYVPDDEAFVQRDKAAKEQPARAAWSAYTSGSPIGDIAVRLGMTIKQTQELVEEGHKLAAADAGVSMDKTRTPERTPIDRNLTYEQLRGLNITREQWDKLAQEFDRSRSVNKASKKAGVTWNAAKRALTMSGRQTRIKAKHFSKQGEQQSVSESAKQAKQTPPITAASLRERLVADLEEAQRAITALDAVAQIYGDEPSVLQAIMQTYQRRREVA